MKAVAFLCLVLAGCAVTSRSASAADSRPNLILFLIDDQNEEQLGCYGGETWTPHLDRLAADGMRFTNAHVSSAVCTPSRYTFLTGRYAGSSHSRLYDEACGGPGRQGSPSFNVALEPDRMNMARLLSEAGYATGFTGKFHLQSQVDFPEFYGRDGVKNVPKDLPAGRETQELFVRNEAAMRRYIQSLGFTWAEHIWFIAALRAPVVETGTC
jgi:arylsulfatase A